MLTRAQADLDLIESYLDAVPRSAADAEETGPFTVFRSKGPGPYYARPRLGTTDLITADDVRRLVAFQREQGLPQTIEWVVETSPSLARAARAAGLR